MGVRCCSQKAKLKPSALLWWCQHGTCVNTAASYMKEADPAQDKESIESLCALPAPHIPCPLFPPPLEHLQEAIGEFEQMEQELLAQAAKDAGAAAPTIRARAQDAPAAHPASPTVAPSLPPRKITTVGLAAARAQRVASEQDDLRANDHDGDFPRTTAQPRRGESGPAMEHDAHNEKSNRADAKNSDAAAVEAADKVAAAALVAQSKPSVARAAVFELTTRRTMHDAADSDHPAQHQQAAPYKGRVGEEVSDDGQQAEGDDKQQSEEVADSYDAEDAEEAEEEDEGETDDDAQDAVPAKGNNDNQPPTTTPRSRPRPGI